MRKASKHSAILLLIGVFALGLLGAAYTLWYENLTLKADITTGTLDADVSLHPFDWDEGVFGDGTSEVGAYPQAGLSVVAKLPDTANTTVTALLDSDYDAFGGDNWFEAGRRKPRVNCDAAITSNAGGANGNTGDENVLTLNMSGLFPFAGCEYVIDVHNSGTVPFHIALTSLTLIGCDIVNNAEVNCGPLTAAPWSIGLAPDSSAACIAFLGSLWPPTLNNQIDVNGTPLQLHTNDEVQCRFKLILDQANVESKSYHFTATWTAYQWNELPPPIAP